MGICSRVSRSNVNDLLKSQLYNVFNTSETLNKLVNLHKDYYDSTI
jgi:hypothetical protein